MSLSKLEKSIEEMALKYAKTNKKVIAKKLTDTSIYPSEDNPVSVFMAGSPGAGKTESSIALIQAITTDEQSIIRVDPDELRDFFDDYDGTNAYLFQKAVSVLVEKAHDMVLKHKQSFLLDGTLANYSIAEKNIQRSLNKKRLVQIIYVYQEPKQAWEFVLARELSEGRRVLLKHFIEQYFKAREVVNQLKSAYKRKIIVDLLLKNIDGSDRVYQANIDNIDNHVPEKYSRDQLEELLKLTYSDNHDTQKHS